MRRTTLRTRKPVKVGPRPPRSLPAVRRSATESVIRSCVISSFFWARAAMTVKAIEPIGVEVSMSPHPC